MYGNVGEWCADWYGHTYFEAHIAGANPNHRHYPGIIEQNKRLVLQISPLSEDVKLPLFFSGSKFGRPLELLPILDPVGPSTEQVIKRRDKGRYWGNRVMRGGTFNTPFQGVMSDSRLGVWTTDSFSNIGFRVVFDKKVSPTGHEFHHTFNARRENASYSVSNNNIGRFRDQNGALCFAPKKSGEWAEITFRYDLPFVISSARVKLKVAVLRKLDPKAQVELLVSTDGHRWTTLVIAKETEAKTYLIEVSNETLDPQIGQALQETLRGSRTAFVRIRGFFSLDGDGNNRNAQLLRDEDDSNVYEFHATGVPDRNQRDKTLQQLRKSLDADPGNVLTIHAIGLALAKQGDLDEAIVQLKAALSITAANNLSHYYLGLALLANNRMDEAISHLKLAVEIRPANSMQPVLGSTNTPTGELEKEAVKFRLATGTNRLDARAYYELGRDLLQKNKSFEAIVYFSEAVRADVPLSFLQHNLEVAVLKEQLVRLGRGLEEDKDNVLALYRRGAIQLQLGKHRGAREDLERVLNLNPQHVNALNDLAWLLATSSENELRDGKQAIKLALQANELSQFKTPYFLSTLAAAYAETGNYEKAVEWSNKAITLFPRDEIPEQFEAELKSYQQQKPWREKADPTSLVKDRK